MKRELRKSLKIIEGTKVDVNLPIIKISGPKGSVEKKFKITKGISIEKKDNEIIIAHEKATKKEKKLIGCIAGILNSLMKGVNEEYEYEVMICAAHFPMTVKIEGNRLLIKNFFGENKDREIKIPTGAKVSIHGDIIKITSPDKELAGLTASALEGATRLTTKDRRIFQDGLWIVKKQKGKQR